jgi:hypothetical protein
MTERQHDPATDPEEEGIPDLQEGTPQQEYAEDPQQQAVPGDEPAAVRDFGTTTEEEREGEPLDDRLTREQADPAMSADPAATSGMEPGSDQGPHRLLEPDAGASQDAEPGAVASDIGRDAGGFSGEERAVRVEDESDLDAAPAGDLVDVDAGAPSDEDSADDAALRSAAMDEMSDRSTEA